MAILYIEDDLGLATLLESILTRLGHRVDFAHSAEAGLQLLEQSAYDLLLLDNNLPDLSGLDLLQRLKQRHHPIPVVMLMAGGSEAVAVEAFRLGAADYLIKDAELNYLELLPLTVEKVLEQRKLREDYTLALTQLQQQEDRYRQAMEGTPDGILISLDGRLEMINPAGSFLLGLDTPEQGRGRHLLEFFHPESVAQVQAFLDQLQHPQRSGAPLRSLLLHPGGRALAVELSALPFQYQGLPAQLTVLRPAPH